MGAFRPRAVRLISAAACLAAVGAAFASEAPDTTNHLAICPNGMVPNPRGYGCVPALSGTDWPGGGLVGAPSQEVLTRCDGNYYICIWPYPTM